MWLPLEIPAGQYRNGTELQAQGRWRDCNLVRWQEGAMQTIGGWRPRSVSGTSLELSSTPRRAIAWEDLAGNRWHAYGSFDQLQVVDDEDVVSDITPAGFTSGQVDDTANFGYGSGGFGTLWYGEPRPDVGARTPATVWHLDTFGENLVGCSPDDGVLYEWTLDVGTPAAAIANAPTSCRGLVVTGQRFLFALGAGGDPRKVAWSDREDNTTWTPLATNEAGDFNLQTSGIIRQGLQVEDNTLILTNLDAHVATPDSSFVYNFRQVGAACGAISRNCAIGVRQGAVWMGERGFFGYFGGAVEEMPCEVSDYVFTDINRAQTSKVTVISNEEWGEVWWFYPSSDSVENNRYVSYDLRENIWMTGNLDRTAGFDGGVFNLPFWVASDGSVFEHEVAERFGDSTPYAESGPISIQQGANIFLGRYLYPDEKTQGDVTATFKTRLHANGDETSHGPYSMAEPTPVRFAGRQMRMRVEGDSNWRVGIMRVEGGQGGRR